MKISGCHRSETTRPRLASRPRLHLHVRKHGNDILIVLRDAFTGNP
jgi:hypothetical protein